MKINSEKLILTLSFEGPTSIATRDVGANALNITSRHIVLEVVEVLSSGIVPLIIRNPQKKGFDAPITIV